MSKTPRLIDIADLANVSIGTVDRVLHNRGRVSLKTRDKVLKIVKDIGYQRNIHASILAGSNRSTHVGIMVPRRGMDPFWDRVHLGIDKVIEELTQHNVRLTYEDFDLFDADDFVRKVEDLKKDVYDGLLIAPVFHRQWPELDACLQDRNIPHVLINTLADDRHESFLCYVGPDAYQSGRLAARLLALHCRQEDQVMMIPLEQDFKNAFHMLEKERGFRECFHQIAPSVEVITSEFEAYNDSSALGEFMTEKIKEYVNLRGIYTSASRIHKIAAYFEKQGIDGIKLIGYDSLDENLKYLNSGQIDYLINQNPVLMGYLGLTYLCKFLVFKSQPEQLNYLPLDVILPENLHYYQNHYLLQDKMFVPFT